MLIRDRSIYWSTALGDVDSQTNDSDDDHEGISAKYPKGSNYWDLERSLIPMLARLKENSLLSFRFVDFGTSVSLS